MTKSELVRVLAEDFELPRRQVNDLVEGLLDKITEVLKSGDKVALTPFGQFRIRDRAARIARNPQTGEPVNVPAKRVLRFTAGRTLKEAVGAPKRGGAKKTAPRSRRQKIRCQEGPRRRKPSPRRPRPRKRPPKKR